MRSIALYVCVFALAACSSEGTAQTSAPIAGGNGSQSGQSGDPKGGGGGGGAAGAPSVTAGCTLTQGFWKTHPSAWPVKSLTIGGVSYSEQQLLDIFNTPPKGDASIVLAHQLIAALLNTANGAVPSPAAKQSIHDAQAWMAANRGDAGGLPFGVSAGSAAGQQATALTNTLDNFNSDHCGGSSDGGGSSGSSSGASSGSDDGGSSCFGATACPSGDNSECSAGMQCIEGCCAPGPINPPPSTTPDAQATR
ncbi:MAG TPA: hypothetical protein VKU41_32320 [Polyangiaceae bacterium]|nr:hypothetical protein [Polyangiaceae bacterium]